MGAAVSACVRAVRAGEWLKQGRKRLASGAHGTATQTRERATSQGADEAAPLDREGESECEKAGRDADKWGPPISGRRRARGGGQLGWMRQKAEEGWQLGFFGFPFCFLISNPFFFCFSPLNSNSNKLKIQIQIIQTCALNKRII